MFKSYIDFKELTQNNYTVYTISRKLLRKRLAFDVMCCLFFLVLTLIIPCWLCTTLIDLDNLNTFQYIITIIISIGYGCLHYYFYTRIFLDSVLWDKLYFYTCTTRGKAILKRDFHTIKKNNCNLYYLISTQKCKKYCLHVCWHICKIIKKGCIQFIAVSDDNKSKRNYTMHVVYVNDGYAFDVKSQSQWPVDKLYAIYNPKEFKKFTFNEFKDKTYEEFKNDIAQELIDWCNSNDCSQYFVKDH